MCVYTDVCIYSYVYLRTPSQGLLAKGLRAKGLQAKDSEPWTLHIMYHVFNVLGGAASGELWGGAVSPTSKARGGTGGRDTTTNIIFSSHRAPVRWRPVMK